MKRSDVRYLEIDTYIILILDKGFLQQDINRANHEEKDKLNNIKMKKTVLIKG